MIAVNGQQSRIIDPTTGLPFESRDRFAVPPVLSYSSLLNQSMQIYSAVRRDDAIRFGRRDALAMERDTFLQAIMEERYEATSLLKFHVEAEDPKDPVQKADADWHQKIIERTPNFQRYKRSLLYAIWFGRSGVQHVINRPKSEQIMGRAVWRVVDHSPVRGDKIEFTYQLDDEESRERYGNVKIREGMPIIFLNGAQSDKIRLMGGHVTQTDQYPGLLLTDGYWRERFVIHKHLTKDYDPFEEPEKQGCIHGFGVRDQIFWMDWIRKEWLANVSDFIDQIGKGCQIYPYDASNPANEDKAAEAAKKQSRNTIIVWPVWPGQGGQLLPQPMNIPMGGSEILLKLMEHMEAIIERYIIGQTGSSRSETSGLGTHSTDFMESTKYNRIRWDAQNLEETLTEQLLAPLHRLNSPNARYKLFFKFDIDKPDAAQMLQAAGTLYQMNIPFKEDEARGFAGYSKPEDGDAVVSQMQVQQMQQEQQLVMAQKQAELQGQQALQQHALEQDAQANQHAMKKDQNAQQGDLKAQQAVQQAAAKQGVPQ